MSTISGIFDRVGFRWMLATLVAALVLAACGADSGRSTAPPVAPTSQSRGSTAPQPTAPAAAAPAQTEARPTAQAAPAAPATPAGEVLGAQSLPPCTVGAALTPAQTEGPYYKANPPERASLVEPGMAGTRLTISGYVVTADCKPVTGTRVDFWQADDQGRYDNSGYKLRGYTLTDDKGRFEMETIVPGLYPGRTRHIHVKVGASLTTQLYFPDEAANSRDSIFNPNLVMSIQDAGNGKAATFNFVTASS